MCEGVKNETKYYVVAYGTEHDCIASAVEHNEYKILACTEDFKFPLETAEFIMQAVNETLKLDNILKERGTQ